MVYNPPKQDGVDDVTGEALQQREDDTEATVRERLSVYYEQTQPLVDFYGGKGEIKYLEIDGSGAVEDIQAAIALGLGEEIVDQHSKSLNGRMLTRLPTGKSALSSGSRSSSLHR